MKIYLLNVIALRPVTMTAKRYDGPLTCIIITSSCSFREYPITVFFLLILLLQSTLFSFFFHLHFFFFFIYTEMYPTNSREGPTNKHLLFK